MALVSTAVTVPEILPGVAEAELVLSAARETAGTISMLALKTAAATNLANDIFMFFWFNLPVVRVGLVLRNGYRLWHGFTSKIWWQRATLGHGCYQVSHRGFQVR